MTIDFIIGFDVLINLVSESVKDIHVRKYIKEAAFAYLKSYLVVDVLSFLPGLVTWEQNSNLYYFKLCRFLRIKRFFAFFKYLNSFFCNWFQNNNKYKQIVLKMSSILKLILIYYFICHVFACIWLLLGIDGTESYEQTEVTDGKPYGWIDKIGDSSLTVFQQYIRSLYFTIATLTTVGYGDYHATNTDEAIFIMVMIMVGQQLYSFLMGSLKDRLVEHELIT